MKKTVVTIILPLLLVSQYNFALASCYMCTEGILKNIELIKSTPEKVESLFNKLELSDDLTYINFNETYTLKYLNAEFTYVFSKEGNIYLFVEKEGELIGAVNQNEGERSIILPQDIQPEGLCEVICYLVFGQSSISVIACFLNPLAKTLFPFDDELFLLLSKTCSNGMVGILLFLACSFGQCH